MEEFSFVFTVFFMVLGPGKIIAPFAALTRATDAAFKRSVAIRGALIAAVLCAFSALAAQFLLSHYRMSFEALRISGALVLLVSALQTIFHKEEHPNPPGGTPNAQRLAVSPVAVPIVVPPAGVVAILIFMLFEPQFPGVTKAVLIALPAVLVVDFLVMYFIDAVVRTPGLGIGLTVLGAVLIFGQLGLSIEMFLSALKALGVLRA